MGIPTDFVLTVEDIRYLRHSQLSLLTNIQSTNFPRWDQGCCISERNLARIAAGLYVTKAETLHSFELRRKDTAIARAAQEKAELLIEFLGLKQEPA